MSLMQAPDGRVLEIVDQGVAALLALGWKHADEVDPEITDEAADDEEPESSSSARKRTLK